MGQTLRRFFASVLGVLAARGKRAQLLRAIVGREELTQELRNTLLFLVLLASAVFWVVGATVLRVALPEWAGSWNALLLVYFHALTTNLFNPIPVEPTVLAASLTIGSVAAVVAGCVGKVVGAWLIFSLGPVLRKAARKLEDRSSKIAAGMEKAHGIARRYGYLALAAMLAVPGSPFDIVPIYLFSIMDLRLPLFLGAVFLGYAIRLGAVVLFGTVALG